MTPEFRERARAALVEDEGLRLRVYEDTVGVPTVGVGRNLPAMGLTRSEIDELRKTGITREQAFEWLDQDIDQAERDCRRIFGDELWESWSSTRQAGWLNFTFNLGMPRAMSFYRTIKAAKEGNWARVRQGLENSLWAVQVKGRAKRVIAAVCDEEWLYG